MSEERVTELEIKVAFLEHSLGELDGVVRDLSNQVDALQREVKRLREAEQQRGEAPPVEKPPHF